VLADTLRRVLTAPITFGEREIFLTASIGIALPEPGSQVKADDVLRNAEIAMMHAKRFGGEPDRGVSPRPCRLDEPIVSRLRWTCGGLWSVTKSVFCFSRSCGLKTAPWRALKRSYGVDHPEHAGAAGIHRYRRRAARSPIWGCS
jgi:hypothetical protein